MKQFYTILLLFSSLITFGQAPAGYYDSATGNGYTLKSQLKEIIDDNVDGLATEYTHNDQGDNLDPLYGSSDIDNYYENDGSILDIYSERPLAADSYSYTFEDDECGTYSGEGECYNKEHIIPQSVVNNQSPMIYDAHHIVPTDGRVNQFRGSYPFGVVDDSQLISQSGITNPTTNGSKAGGNLDSGYSAGYTGIVFEPIDEFKGDVARMYFYFVTRYEDQVNNWSSYDMFDGSNDKAIADPFLSILLTWHQMDPVSTREIDRNNAVFNYQNNRNPFVDHPEYVTAIWSVTPDTEDPTAPTNLMALNPTDNSITLNWNAATDNVGVASYDIYVDDIFSTNVNTLTTIINGLTANTNYCFKVKALDFAGNESQFSNEDCEMTTNNGSSNVDLFFSEYMEGSGTNKALEIANFTGNTVDLSSYSLKLSSNGNPSWTTTYMFPVSAEIVNEDVYVIANGGSVVCTDADDDLNNAITGFNGNDAIGLFKNDILIDIIGTLGDNTVFAENTTLVRKPEIEMPTTTFDINEWNSFASNTCDDLGMHTQTLSTENFQTNEIVIYPNPIKGNYLNIKANGTLKITLYTILGKSILTTNKKKINVSGLKKGVYLLKVQSDTGVLIKKIIRN